MINVKINNDLQMKSQIKLFSHSWTSELELKVNEWLLSNTNPIEDIIYSSSGKDGAVVYSVMIIYRIPVTK